jgi:alpha-ketoglutarate-dependent taurine dioxygenase
VGYPRRVTQLPVVVGEGEPLSSIPRARKLALIREHGGVLFRGFHVDHDEFVRLGNELGARFYNMALDARIREMVSSDGQVAGVIKGTGALPLHMERGYSPLKPELVMFHVVTPSPVGGESLLGSGERVLAALPPAMVERFRRTRLMYRHVWEPEAWRGRYGATRDEVARVLAHRPDILDVRFDGELLHYSYLVSAIVRSRLGGGDAFCNNIEGAWEVQIASPETRRAVHEHVVMFEDGAPMTGDIIAAVRAAVDSVTEVHAIQAGDVEVLDNYRVMHGRRSFEGPRVMHTIMADAAF